MLSSIIIPSPAPSSLKVHLHHPLECAWKSFCPVAGDDLGQAYVLGSLIAAAGRGFNPNQASVLRLSLAASLLFFQEVVLVPPSVECTGIRVTSRRFFLLYQGTRRECGDFWWSAVNKKAKYCVSGTLESFSQKTKLKTNKQKNIVM